jgi:hypothetical protein
MKKPTIDEMIATIRRICRTYESSTDKVQRIWKYLEAVEGMK